MNIQGTHYRTIWVKPENNKIIQIIDQHKLPHHFEVMDLATVEDMARAIKEMHVRGAGLIGASAGYGMYLAALEAPSDSLESFSKSLRASAEKLVKTRPTAKNLEWAVNRQLSEIDKASTIDQKRELAFATAQAIADEDAEFCRKLGEYGLSIIEEISKKKGGETVNILTHCNAGWLAFVDFGSATSPIYAAYEKGIKVHVYVDETRPRNQGASLTAWELGNHGVSHTLIADNTGGHLMQHGMVDMVITGADRVTRSGDAANKIGTYLKALAAHDNNVPFYVALPSSTFDWEIDDGVKEIEIETRNENEVRYMQGLSGGELKEVLICPESTRAINYGFDVTPSRLIKGLITERGVCDADKTAIAKLYGDKL